MTLGEKEAPVLVDLVIEVGLDVPSTKGKKQNGPSGWTSVMVLTSDLELVDFRRIAYAPLESTGSLTQLIHLATAQESFWNPRATQSLRRSTNLVK